MKTSKGNDTEQIRTQGVVFPSDMLCGVIFKDNFFLNFCTDIKEEFKIKKYQAPDSHVSLHIFFCPQKEIIRAMLAGKFLRLIDFIPMVSEHGHLY